MENMQKGKRACRHWRSSKGFKMHKELQLKNDEGNTEND